MMVMMLAHFWPWHCLLLLAISTLAFAQCNDSAWKGAGHQQQGEPSSVPSTFLWSIDSPSRSVRSFLFGTIHVPYDRVWDHVSNRAKQALDAAETVVFELDVQSAETVAQLAECKQLEAGDSLRTMLPPAMFERLRAYMHRLKQRILRWNRHDEHNNIREERQQARRELRRIFPGDWDHRRPVWLLFLLLQLCDHQLPARRAQPQAPMLDLHLAQLAHAQGKQLLSMESAAEQCNPLESVGESQLQFAINYTLAYLEWTEAEEERRRKRNGSAMESAELKMTAIDKLVEQYKCGTLDVMFGAHRFARNGFSAGPEADQRAREVDNLLMEDILLRRNERMARRADLLLRSRPSTVFFFALGAGHLLGTHRSLLNHLRQLGYWLAPIGDSDLPPRLISGAEPLPVDLPLAHRRITVQIREVPARAAAPKADKMAPLVAVMILALAKPFFLFCCFFHHHF